MDTPAITSQVMELVREKLLNKDTPLSEIALTARFVEDLGADSLDQVELIMGLEEAFGISIPDEVAQQIKTVGDAIDHIAAHLNQQPQEDAS